MTQDKTIRARWHGEAFHPSGNWSTAWCHDNLRDGALVNIEVSFDRSGKTHRHQFAWIREAWRNLPESLADAPYAKSEDALRKHALIKCGYCDVQTVDAGSKAAAIRCAALASSLAEHAYGYAIVKVDGPLVICLTPHSQSARAMGAKRFQESKEAILTWIAGLLEVTPEQLRGSDAA